MVNFVVVEDNKMHRKRIKNIILNYMMKNKIEFDIIEFEDYNKDLENLMRLSDDNNIYIFDFELPSTTAIDLSRKLRETDWVSPIIVFTVNGGMAYDTFKQRLQILDFVNKQFEAEKNLHELFDICFKQFSSKKTLDFRYKGIDYNLDMNKILYIYRDTVERKCIINTTNNKKYKVIMNISDLSKKLDNRFKFTHKACLVNTDKVEAYVWKENKIIFETGEEIYFLSKTHKKELINE